jgi:DnaJ-class molecular chaperone
LQVTIRTYQAPDRDSLYDIYSLAKGLRVWEKSDVTFPDASLGTDVEVPTLEGTTKLKIPGGTQSKTVFRLKGMGVPHLGRAGRRMQQGAGGLLVVMGALMLTGQLELIAYWLLETFPALGTIG